ncbi:MAG: folylpolyglutamate synthase/dihydrofolate synthase family protein [Acidimicrobiales bacterium]
MNYREALDYLDRRTRFEGTRHGAAPPKMPTAGATEGLDLHAITDLMRVLGDPHTAYRTIHITGTNGKGSTARFASALLKATGLSVGTYTSPNIERINERLVWDGNYITDADFARVIGLIADVEHLLETNPGRFEILTAAAFVWFAELGVEAAVIEVGLLGRFDATNVIDADVAVITNIGKDHTDGEANWEQAVAREKAGIIKPDGRVVLGSVFGDLREIVEAEQPDLEIWEFDHDFFVDRNEVAVGGRVADIRTTFANYEDLYIPFHGSHQAQNVATALAAVEAFFGRSLDRDLVDEAIASVELPGRFEVVSRSPMVILDGAHNPHGATAAQETLATEFARLGSWILVVGFLVGKDPVEMLDALGAPDFDAVIICQPTWSRAQDAYEVAKAARTIGIEAEVVVDPVEAFTRAKTVAGADDLILVAGSLYVVGEIRPAARATEFD